MLPDWLRRAPDRPPQIEVAGQMLPLTIRRSAQAKRLTMRLAPDGSEVRVTLPRWGRSEDALAFARSQADWLTAQLAACPKGVEIGHGTRIALFGIDHELRHEPRAPRRPRAGDAVLVVGGPAENLGPRLRRWLEGEARRVLAEDLAEYCTRAAQPVPRLLLSRAQRRWGSCSSRGEVRINWRLVMAPPEVRRSVVAHEVTHLVHFDHSAQFHALLDELYEGDIRAANRWLKAHGRSLYLPFG